jgi:hypothetical protein
VPSNDAAEAVTIPPPRWRRYWKAAVAVLGAFGILGAVGGYLVNSIGPDVEEKLTGGSPLRIAVREDPQGGGDGFHVATQSPTGLTAKLREAKDCDSLFRLAKRAGAVDVRRSIHNVVLEGRTHRDVAIVDMRARILRRASIFTGAEISCASAGAIDAIGVGFNLDEPNPAARRIKDLPSGKLGDPYFGRGNIVSLRKTEVQPLQIVGLANRAYIEWEIDARVVIDGEEKKITIDNNGQPFRITGGTPPGEASARYSHYYEWVWYETPQRLSISDKPST